MKNNRSLFCLLAIITLSAPVCAAKTVGQSRTSESLFNAVADKSSPTVAVAHNSSLPLNQTQKTALEHHLDVLQTTAAQQVTEQPTPINESSPVSQQAPKVTISQTENVPKAYLKQDTASAPNAENDDNKIEFNFEGADLQNLVSHISELYGVTFITDDSIYPKSPTGQGVQGSKISFKTQKPLSRKEAWNLFVTFLDMTGLAIIPEATPNFYRITSLKVAQKSPIPAFIGVEPNSLPDSDQVIRYVYFLANAAPDIIEKVINDLRSPAASLTVLKDLKAFLIIDKSYNIKSLMKIVLELDKVTMPQAMSVLKLRKTDVEQVKALYEKLVSSDQSKFFTPRKMPTSQFFPENIRIIAEKRTNALILLGPSDAIKKIEDFIIAYIDIDVDNPYSPLRIYQLKYADATTIASIMNDVTKFNQNTPAGAYGGVRDGDKYLRPMSFIAETQTNRLIVKGDEEDYLKAKEILDKLDEPQPQVAMEVLILSLRLNKSKELGAQLRNKIPGVNGLLGNNVSFQTSGLRSGGNPGSIQENSVGTLGTQRLLGNLLNLVSNTPSGNTFISLGKDIYGVWGLLQMLDTVSTLNVVSNPFLVATNNTAANVVLGETRRVITSTIVATNNTNNFSDEKANLDVKITPQINSDGMIVLALDITIDEFTNTDIGDATKTTKHLITNTIVADREVLALGGLMRNRKAEVTSQTPLLSTIPVLGWLFKNKRSEDVKENLLILISTRIIKPFDKQIGSYTLDRISDYKTNVLAMSKPEDAFDPIHRWYFKEGAQGTDKVMNKFFFKRKKKAKNKKQRMTPIQEPSAPAKTQLASKQQPQQQVAQVPMEELTFGPLIEKMKGKSTPSLTYLLSDNQSRTNT